MMISNDYIDSLPAIYRDVVHAYAIFTPQHRVGDGVSFQSLYSGMSDKYTFAQVRTACEKMAESGAFEIRNGIFLHPLDRGAELIAAVVGGDAAEPEVPDFPPVPTASAS